MDGATSVFKHGMLTKIQHNRLNNQTVFKNMEHDETHQYVGTEESDGIDNIQMKDKVVKEQYRQVRQIPKTELKTRRTGSQL
jgi:hypothetical protein